MAHRSGPRDSVAWPVSANAASQRSTSSREKIKMHRIKKREWCMACLSESATRPQPATIKLKMGPGVRLLFCEEHFKVYCRMVADEDWQGSILH